MGCKPIAPGSARWGASLEAIVACAIWAGKAAIGKIQQIQQGDICSGTLSAKMKGACQYILLEEFLYLG